ncbi:N-acetylmuramoyl-L-alanine amidase [Luteimonas sp. FCS-9]|uniref:N-acetylmuramoyl-L-alanine amidase n=1 Tax=Luteimonas sp. FCS-9 TaxID=1547516 RepID=UPI00063E89E2|nr:N-acetylmuramoyl-L-alanine amidase [Luteimonas sp. FCS-9]KLI98262.1 N-acetylmuramoyl-L-alanine amidase [Luteimonas sp. FCS-9]
MSRRLSIALVALLLAACAHQAPRNPLATWVPSANHDPRRPVLVVLHYTEQDSVERSLDTLRTANSGGRVSAHYLIGKRGERYQLVSDLDRAWHAGAGRWGAITDVNSASIGIELDNNGREPFAEPLVESLLVLLEDLRTRWRIAPENVIGHSDLAPARKIDPGVHFPWRRLAEHGYGVWPQDGTPPAPPGFDALQALRTLGYATDDPDATARAFRLRFRAQATGGLDDEDRRILYALVQGWTIPATRRAAPAPRD